MTEPLSLALLKGQDAPPVAPEPEFDGPIEQVEEIKKASAKALETLLSDNETPPPEGWASMDLAAKRKWVLAKFEAEGAEENAAADQGDDATAGKPFDPPFEPDAAKTEAEPEKPAKGKGKGKKAKAEPAAETASEPAPEATAATNDAPTPQVAPAEPTGPTEEQLAKEIAEANPKPAKAKGKKASTEVAKVQSGEIMEKDVLQDIVYEVENMKKDVALQLVAELSEATDVAFFRLGGILSVVASNNWWKTDDGKYETFRAYIEQEHGLEYRKATYWISIYNALAKAGVPWSKVKEVGWTKLKEIAKVLTPENVDTWVDTAKQVNTLTLHDMVKKKSDEAEDGAPAEAEKLTTKTFKVHAGQKEVIENALAKAKQESGTDVDTVALERICLDYLSGTSEGSKTPAQKLAALVKGLDMEIVMHVVDEAFPDYDFTVDKKDEAGDKAA